MAITPVDDRPDDVGFNPTAGDSTTFAPTTDRPHPLDRYEDKSILPDDYMFSIWWAPTNQYEDFSYGTLKENGILNPGIMKSAVNPEKNTNFDAMMKTIQSTVDALHSGGGGRGGGGGAAGPVYVKPDERLVRDAVETRLALMVGQANPDLVQEYTELYMAESQRAFDMRESEQIDPMASVMEKIRAQDDYQAIHQLRPDSVDELQWVSSRQGALIRAGVTPTTATELGISQATVGASEQEAVEAGNIYTFESSGQKLDSLKNRIGNSAYGALSLV